MIRDYFCSLVPGSGGTPPPPLTYNPVCITKSTESIGIQAFFKATATYTVGQSTNVTVTVTTMYNSGSMTKNYTITRTIPSGATQSGNVKLLYTSGYDDEYFIGVGDFSFSPAVDAGGRTFSDNGQC